MRKGKSKKRAKDEEVNGEGGKMEERRCPGRPHAGLKKAQSFISDGYCCAREGMQTNVVTSRFLLLDYCTLDTCLVLHLIQWPDLCCMQQHFLHSFYLKSKGDEGVHYQSSAHGHLKPCYKCSTGKPQKYVGLPTKSRARLTNDVNEDTQFPMKWSDFIRIAQSITANHGSAWKTWTCVQQHHSTYNSITSITRHSTVKTDRVGRYTVKQR